ncbi:hypothetical protein CPB83DRAFT_891744 [Crepidotus variabilis]|uniref:Uncharacterized protein n=1 Tax=Crepidotus variabilis TaxID=179855 RepID=A0A9P6ELQ2_9AGAR|nr:hypothetical protein CPB83DRAFT_891744 [Crepidotus variabilis]
MASNLNVHNILTSTVQHSSWIILDSKNVNHLYAVNEVSAGAVQACTIDSQGFLGTPTDIITSGGDGPAYATVLSSRAVAVVN